MRIGFFVWEYPPRLVGGLGTYAEYITKEFVSLGHDVSVFTLNDGQLKTREIIGGVDVQRPLIADASMVFPLLVTDDLKKWGTNIKFFNDIFIYNILSATKFINHCIRKEHTTYEIVCFHDWLSSISGLMIKKELDLPTVFHVHSTEWGRTGGMGSEVVTHLERTSAEMSDQIVTVSHAMKDDLAKHGWPESKMSVVWNGVDPRKYDPCLAKAEDIKRIRERYEIEDKDQMVLFLGRLTWVKGVRNLVQAISLVAQEFPNVRLVILGRGEEQRDIEELASRLGISERVKYRFEFVPEAERILHYAASDLCVFPSTYEPFGIVSLEAMSMEKPIVVGARGVVGFREQVMNMGAEQNGVHVNGENPADIAWGIREVLKDPERAKRWGKNGRRRVLNFFTWKKVAEQTVELYNKLIK
ncbi:MAG: glycosyltransferase family 4 protein [Thermoproteota archaeon]